MKEFFNGFQIALVAIGACLGGFFGGCDGFLYALIALTVIDYITGVMMAIVQKKLSSEIGFKGIFKKILIFMMVAIAHLIDTMIIDSGSAIRTAVIFFYLSNEGISILENAAAIGLPIPEKLKIILRQLGEEGEKHD